MRREGATAGAVAAVVAATRAAAGLGEAALAARYTLPAVPRRGVEWVAATESGVDAVGSLSV